MNEENNKKITTHLSSDHFWIEEAKKDAILVEEAKTKGQNAKAKKASSKGSRIKKTDQKVDQEETKDNHRCEAESTSSNSTGDLSSAVELSSDCFKYEVLRKNYQALRHHYSHLRHRYCELENSRKASSSVTRRQKKKNALDSDKKRRMSE